MNDTNYKNESIKISLDAMGGDYAPQATVEGAVLAAREFNIATVLVGDESQIRAELAKHDITNLPLEVKHTPDVITMDESPLNILRKNKDCSLRIAFELVKTGEYQAVITAGNSGAALTASLFVLDSLKGIDRPAIATAIPTLKGSVIVIDAGANNICKPFHLVQFALMASVYSNCLLDKAAPRIGVLSNGEEESKGTKLTREANALLKETSLNYIGYVEGKEIFKGDVDIVVCDGFVGNILLKVSEGIAEAIIGALKNEIQKSVSSQLGFALAKKSFSNYKKTFDYSSYGGAPLLGVNGGVIISHGRSSAKAIKNAIKAAHDFVSSRVIHHLEETLKESKDFHTVGKKPGLFDKVIKKDSQKD